MKNILITILVFLSLSTPFAWGESDNLIFDQVLKRAEQFNYDHCNENSPFEVSDFIVIQQPEGEPAPLPVRYFIASCLNGAYNQSSILFRLDREQVVQIEPLTTPIVSDQNKIIGWTSQMVNDGMTYDENTKLLTTYSKNRGIGDASTTFIYGFYAGQVLLREAKIDKTYDGRINPVTVWRSRVSIPELKIKSR